MFQLTSFLRSKEVPLSILILILGMSGIAFSDDASDLAKIKQQISDLQAQLSLLQAQSQLATGKATLAQATADAAQAGAKETALNQASIATSLATTAQQNRNALTSTFPTNLVTPLEGKMAVDSSYKFPPQVLTYSASDSMITSIVDGFYPYLERVKAKTVLLYATSELTPDLKASYASVSKTLQDDATLLNSQSGKYASLDPGKLADASIDELAQHFVDDAIAHQATPPPKNGPPGSPMAALSSAETAVTAANSTLQSVIQLISLFRTDTTIAGTTTDADVEALEAQFCFHLLYDRTGQVRKNSVAVQTSSTLSFDSSLLTASIDTMRKTQSEAGKTSSKIKSLVAALPTREQAVEAAIRDLLKTKQYENVANPGAVIQTAQSATAKAYKTLTDEANALSKAISDLDTSATALITALQTPDSKTGVLPLGTLLKTEALTKAIKKDNLYTLSIKSVAAGGATRIDKNLFTGSRLKQMGGVVFLATLSDKDGNIVYSNASKGFVGFTKMSDTTAINQQDIKADRHFLWWRLPSKSTPTFTLP